MPTAETGLLFVIRALPCREVSPGLRENLPDPHRIIFLAGKDILAKSQDCGESAAVRPLADGQAIKDFLRTTSAVR
jgi:hypothetical protein